MFRFNRFYKQTKKSELRLEVFGGSIAGRKRTTNEDAFLIGDTNSTNKLLAVADAFNRPGGEEASRLAVNELRDLLLMPSAWNIEQRLNAAFEVISRNIGKHFRNIHHGAPVGTTLSAVLIAGNTAHLAHVGNSRVYLVRGGKVSQLTTDDTFAQVLINTGVEPSATSKKTLLQALGIECRLAPALSQVELLPDDYLLLCSDGFSNNLDATEIAGIVKENLSVETAVERLIEAADERDGADNITVVLARAYLSVATRTDFTTGFYIQESKSKTDSRSL